MSSPRRFAPFSIPLWGMLSFCFTLAACGGVNDGVGTSDPPPSAASGDGDSDNTSGDGDGDETGSSGDGDSGDTPGDGDGTGGNGSVGDGDGDTTSGDGDLVLPPIEEPADPPEGYPEGPYGTGDPKVGDVVENLTFEGFARIGDDILVNTGTVEPISLAEIHDQGKRYALIHTATIWCPSCRTAADDLAARGDELSAMDAVLIELVLEGGTGGIAPTDSELNSWVLGSDLTITTVRPGDGRVRIVFPSREYAFVIDLQTMTVVWQQQALFSNPTITELGIDALLEELN